MISVVDVIQALGSHRFSLNSEAALKREMAQVIPTFKEEYTLDPKNRLDFFRESDGIAIEVKISGSPMSIYKQCERYCAFEQVKCLILVTNKSIGFPSFIDCKPCYLVNLGRSWL